MINGGNASSEIVSGDIYVSDADFASAAYEADKRLYTWQGDFVAKDEGNDWGAAMQRSISAIRYWITLKHIKSREQTRSEDRHWL